MAGGTGVPEDGRSQNSRSVPFIVQFSPAKDRLVSIESLDLKSKSSECVNYIKKRY